MIKSIISTVSESNCSLHLDNTDLKAANWNASSRSRVEGVGRMIGDEDDMRRVQTRNRSTVPPHDYDPCINQLLAHTYKKTHG